LHKLIYSQNRVRGRKGVALRQRRLAKEPLCRHCAAKGIIRPAESPDHIIPLSLGGSDTEDNIQCLCKDCHELKTASEDTAHEAAANHPMWLKPSAIPLKIICGPPCAGKTTYISERSSVGDIIIDIDAIAKTIDPGYAQWTGMLKGSLLDKSIRVRNAMLGALSRMHHGSAWFIVAAPTEQERAWWQGKLGGEVVLLHPGVDECKRRAIARGTPSAVAGIDKWQATSRQVWKAPRSRISEVDVDGWPM
jgi:hypothetical protein